MPLKPDEAILKPGVYDVSKVRLTPNTDGTVKVELIVPVGSLVITIADNADINKAKV